MRSHGSITLASIGVLLCLAVSLCYCSRSWAETERNPDRPNVVVALADDLGYGDLACYGHPVIKTPNLDRLADEGVRLTNCYAAAANCSPARTGLLTGRTPYRVGIHNWIPHLSPMHVRRQEITIATILRNHGYATCHSGKWHLNGKFNRPEQPQPDDHGFDHWFSTQNNAMPWHKNPDNFVRNGDPVGPLEGFSAHLVVDEAIRWLHELRDPRKPFFLYVCFHEPHEPIATAERYTKLYPAVDHPSQATHHGNVTQMDDAMGRLLAALDDMKLRDDTLVIFTSDNGPAITRWHPHGSAGPLREKKGHVYEGGIRVPGIVRWPGRIEPGTVCDEPVSGVDLLPTLCALAGAEVPGDRAVDGASILPLFEGEPLERTTPLYWQFNFARSEPKVAMRIGPWKILATLDVETPRPTADIRAEDQRKIKTARLADMELYHLGRDIGETNDLSDEEPERLAAMAEKLRALYREVQAETPVWPEWESPHLEGQRIRAHREQLRKAGKLPPVPPRKK
jgi:arylsulfatase A